MLEKKEGGDGAGGGGGGDDGGILASSNKKFGQSDDKQSSVKEEIKLKNGKKLPSLGENGNSFVPESSKYDFPQLGAGLNNNKQK